MEQLSQNKIFKIGIVGGGPSGIYCALNILKNFEDKKFRDFKIYIFEKSQILKTILPTGNFRCNITNNIYDINEFILNYPRGQKFLYSLFSRHFNYDSIEFFNSIGIETYVQDDNRVFPISNSSSDVREKMLNQLKKYKNVQFVNKKINSYSELKNFDCVVISCGSRGAVELIKSTEHKIIEFKKALCALDIENNIYPEGVSVSSLEGDFIFTKYGISGPLAFKISSYNAYKKMPYEIEIKLFDEKELFSLIEKFPKKSIGNLVSNFIPKSLSKAIVKDYSKNSCEISKEKIKEYSTLKLKIISTKQDGEIVNAGGVELNELDKNCKSKIKSNLWFCGEVLNIDGLCGGFNLQNCWSSAWVVAKDIESFIIKKSNNKGN